MNIYQRLNEVRKVVDFIRKDKKVGEGGGYMAVTHDAVTALTREHLIKHGILIVPSLISSATNLTGTTTAKGIPYIRYEARYRFDVTSADDPADKFSAEIESHAMDHGDKAPGKALSYAKKYLILKLLEIESGEGEEDREDQKRQKITPMAGAMDRLEEDQRLKVRDTAMSAIGFLEENNVKSAYDAVQLAGLDNDEKVALWSLLSREQRKALGKFNEEQKARG